MNTSSWGPRGWLYFHTTAQNHKNKKYTKDFFQSLKNVLPCKWCRLSYEGFIQELPINGFLGSQEDVAYWMYLVHNKVNDKLRNQGLLKTGDPSFKSVYQKYDRILKSINQGGDLTQANNMWYFLHTVAHNYDPAIHSPKHYTEFFDLVGKTMPYHAIKPLYQHLLKKFSIQNYLGSQSDLTQWLYGIRLSINEALRAQGYPIKNIPSYEAIYNKYDAIRANCAAKKKKTLTNNGRNGVKLKKILVGTCRIPDSKERCKGTTKKGRQCTRRHLNGSRFCTIHLT